MMALTFSRVAGETPVLLWITLSTVARETFALLAISFTPLDAVRSVLFFLLSFIFNPMAKITKYAGMFVFYIKSTGKPIAPIMHSIQGPSGHEVSRPVAPAI